MSIRSRLTLTFGLLVLIMISIAGYSIKSLNDADRRFSSYLAGAAASANQVVAMRQAVDLRAIAVRNLVLVSRPENVSLELDRVGKAHEQVGEALKILKAGGTQGAGDDSEKARHWLGEIDRIEAAYSPVALAIVDMAVKHQKEAAIKKIEEDCRPLLRALESAAEGYSVEAAAHEARVLAKAKLAASHDQLVLSSACALAFLATAVVGVMLIRSITRPIELALQTAEAVAAGDLTQRIECPGAPAEMRKLLGTLAMMSGKLQEVVSNVRNSSGNIATGTSQIASGNADLSQRTEEQASSLQQTAASMEQLNVTVQNNANHARQANELAQTASDIAARGGVAVAEVIATMKTITDSSRRIADIIGVIDGIAFQTNILALNAAVEAARAGEQGRGFAVVATEVRSLAARSASAAREIKTLITSSVSGVEDGTVQVGRAGATIDEVVQSIRRVTEVVAEISAASTEQSAGVAQVGQAITQMDQVTQQNAALVEQSAAAAESLHQQAQRLVAAVQVFKLAPEAVAG